MNPYRRTPPGATIKDPGDWKPPNKGKRQKLKERFLAIKREIWYLLNLAKKRGFE